MENTKLYTPARETSETHDTIWTKDFILLFVISFFMCMGQFMTNTLLPKYAYSLGAVASVVGVVSSMFAVTALGIRPIAGPAMDYFKKNKLLTAAQGVLILALLLYGCAKSISVIIAARLLHGIGIGVAMPLCIALASNSLPAGKMISGIGIFSLGQAIASAVGPTLGLRLSAIFGYNSTFFICSGLVAVSFMLTLFLQNDTPSPTARFKLSLKSIIVPEAVLPSILLFFIFISFACINYFVVIYGGLRGITDIGLFFTVYALALVITRPFGGKLADRFGMDKMVIPGIIVFAVGFVLLFFAHTLPMFLLAAALSAFGFGASEPSIQTLSMQLVSKERRGAAGNTTFMGIDCGNLVGPTVAGFIVTGVQGATGSEVTGFSVMYLIMLLPVAVAFIIFLSNRKKIMEKIRLNKQMQNI